MQRSLRTGAASSWSQVSSSSDKVHHDGDIFQPLFFSIRILGALPDISTKGKSNINTLTIPNWLILFIAHSYLLHLVLAMGSHALRTEKLFEVFPNALCVMRFGAVVISMDHFIFGQRELRVYLEQILQFGGPLSEKSKVSLRRFCLCSVILGWVYTVISVGICLVMGIWTGVDEYLSFYVYEMNKFTGNDTAIARFLVFNDMFEYEFVLSIDMFVILFYLMIVHLIKLKIGDYRLKVQRIRENLYKGSLSTFNELAQDHTGLVEIVRRVDVKYNAIVFLWYLDVMTNIMFSLPTMFVGSPFTDLVNSLYMIWDIFTSIMKFLLVSVVVSEVSSQEDLLTSDLRQAGSAKNQHRYSYVLCNALACKFSSESTLYFTGLQAFRITKNMILSVVGGVVAYTIVLVHILPS